ncbi:helix-turn-helix domain-containing protein [Paenibacillus chartarius]|uniref:Helix-turn-helix domain-containing protein n=1 Tax=Paenibacillus chartarius TaxID=747481 RepID=A0ABV6DP71_9BACL
MSSKEMRLITLQEAMDIFGISRSTIDRWRLTKQLPFIKIGKEVFIDPEELQKWIRSYAADHRDADGRKERRVLKLAIGYQSGTAHMWSSLLIKETGFFEEELKRYYPKHLLEIDWYNGVSGLELLEGMIMGKLHIASLGDYPIKISNTLSRLLPSFQSVLLAFDGKTPQGKGISIAVPAGSPVSTPHDLSGETICTVAHSSASLRLKRLLTEIGGDDAKIIHGNMGDNMNRIVERSVGAGVMWEPYLSLLGYTGGARLLFEEGMGDDYLTGLIASREWAAAHPDIVVAYLKAHLRAHQMMRTQLPQVVKLIRHSTGIPEIVVWKVLSQVRWDSAVYERDLETLSRLDVPAEAAREDGSICTQADYLQMALEQLRLPQVPNSPIRGGWAVEELY